MNIVSLICKAVSGAVLDYIGSAITKETNLPRPIPARNRVRAGVFLCSAILASASNANGRWIDFRFDPEHHGVNPNETILTPANVAELTVKWRITIRGTNGTNFASASVLDDKVYVVSVYTSKVHALNKDTGQELWSFPSDAIEGADHAWTSPAIANNIV